jgi:hypothetical protein
MKSLVSSVALGRFVVRAETAIDELLTVLKKMAAGTSKYLSVNFDIK